MMLAIETRNLSKRYGSFLALNKLNLIVKTGEVYGFIGRNGAGKTTTINLLLSLIQKSEGTILIQGKEINFNDSNYKKKIGYVPDVPIFPGYMNAVEYISYTLDMFQYNKKDRSEKIKEVLDFVGLHNHKKRISSYSRGMKQRLAIAQALIHDPDILIMDEPTSALDPIGRKDVMDIILKLKGKKTIFYSTHILEDAEKVCDRVGLIENGALILEDYITNIQSKYYGKEMELFIHGDDAKAMQILKATFTNVKFNKTDDFITFDATNLDVDNLLRTLIENDISILELKRNNASLEDVFLRVTNEKTT